MESPSQDQSTGVFASIAGARSRDPDEDREDAVQDLYETMSALPRSTGMAAALSFLKSWRMVESERDYLRKIAMFKTDRTLVVESDRVRDYDDYDYDSGMQR